MGVHALITNNEAARLTALRDLRLLETPPSESFDRLTRMASRLLGAPVSTISLTDGDRQWFKSKVGVDLSEIPRDQAPCSYAIEVDEVFIVPDLLKDARFATSPLAQAGIRFYAGAPLITRSGYGLGTICIVDDKPREIGVEDQRVLRDLAGMVMTQIEIQNMIGRVDATSGQPNEHQFFEDLSDLAAGEPGGERASLLVELMSSDQSSHGLRVLGSGYIEDMVKAALEKMRRAMGNGAQLYQVGPSRCLVLWDEATGRDASEMVQTFSALLRESVSCNGIPVMLDPVMGLYRFKLGVGGSRDVLRCLFNAADDARRNAIAVAVYSQAEDQVYTRRFSILHDVPQALEATGELSLVYQPRVELATNRCVGAEALLRWRHPVLGPLSPAEFIPLVEQTAFMRRMTDWVAKEAIRQIAAWTPLAFTPRISINASALNLEEIDFAERIAATLSHYGVRPQQIELEFTESALARDSQHLIDQLNRLRRMGHEIAIDDFGTGYSSLSYLQQLPATILKIDRSFMQGLETEERDRKLVRTMIGMAHDLGFRVVAEGVETKAVYDLLASWNCDEAQGYYMARPMPPLEFENWLRRSRPPSALNQTDGSV